MSNHNYWENFGDDVNPFVGDISPLQLPEPLLSGFSYDTENHHADGDRTIHEQLSRWNWDCASANVLSDQAIPSIENHVDWNQHCVLHDHPTPVSLHDCPLNLPSASPMPNNDFLNSHNPAAPTSVPEWMQYSNLIPTRYVPRDLSLSPESEPPVRSGNRLRAGLQPPKTPWLRPTTSKGPSVKCQGEGCPKNFVPGPNNDGRHCARCYKKIFKSAVGPPVFNFEPNITTFEEAWQRVYPIQPPLKYRGLDTEDEDDFRDHEDSEDYWIQQFIEAANAPYTERDGPNDILDFNATDSDRDQHERARQQHEYFLAQQDTYNKKPYHDSSRDHFTNDEINVRMRFLFRAVITLHRGGPAVYPCGGDNRGYGEDPHLKCSERLRLICDIMAQDKRVLITVIEGRGVNAFAANPRKYADRKTQNKISNETKKKLIVKGTAAQIIDGERPPPRKRGPKKSSKKPHSASPYFGEDEWRA